MSYKLTILLACVLAGGCGVRAKTVANRAASVYSAHNSPICLLADLPPDSIRYDVLGRVVATKRSYGSSDELFGPMVREAQKLGADALVNFEAGQRFKGPLPWRITSPTGDSTAIKIVAGSDKFNCTQLGGSMYSAAGPVPEGSVQSSPSSSSSINASSTDAGSSSGSRDKYSDLERLKKLLDDGALTQEEFDREKARILK